MIVRNSDGGAFETTAGYSRAIKSGKQIMVSSTTAPVSATGSLASLNTYQQTSTALTRALQAVTELGGLTETVTRTRLYLAPSADWEEMARAHREIFSESPPANSVHYVYALIPPGALVEVELDAVSITPRDND